MKPADHTWIGMRDKGVVMRKIICVMTAAMSVAYAQETGQPVPSLVVSKVPRQVAILKCDITGIKSWQVGWRKDGQPVSELGSRFIVKDSGNLVIFVDTVDDEGSYTCYATRGRKFDPYTVYLSVKLLPEVSVVSSEPVRPMEGGAITIVCSGNGKPRPTFEWFSSQEKRLRVGDDLEGSRMRMEERFVDERTIETSLHVFPVTAQDRGQFNCIATNTIGSAREKISVDVQFAPKMLTSNDTKAVNWWEGHRVNLTCLATGNPAPVIAWSPPDVITPIVTVTEGILVSSTLWMSERFSMGFPASFECHAENTHGETDTRVFTVGQVYAPPPPDLSIISIKDDEIKLSVNVPEQMATPTPTYVIADYRRHHSARWMSSGTAFQGNDSVLRLVGIILSRSYVIKVKVFNQVGYGSETTLNVIAEKYSIYDTTTTTPPSTPTPWQGHQSSTNSTTGNGTDTAENVGKSVDESLQVASFGGNAAVRPCPTTLTVVLTTLITTHVWCVVRPNLVRLRG